MKSDVPMSRFFNPGIRAALVAASEVDSHINAPGEVKTRNVAVDKAIAAARRAFPHLFREVK